MEIILDDIRKDFMYLLYNEGCTIYNQYHLIDGYDIGINYHKADDEIVIDIPLFYHKDVLSVLRDEDFLRRIERYFRRLVYRSNGVYFKINVDGISWEFIGPTYKNAENTYLKPTEDDILSFYLPLRNTKYTAYLDLIPEELHNTIVSYLEYQDLKQFTEGFDYKLNWRMISNLRYGQTLGRKTYIEKLNQIKSKLKGYHKNELHINPHYNLDTIDRFSQPKLGYQLDIDLLKGYKINILEIKNIKMKMLPKEIMFLIQLTHLYINECDLEFIPKEITKLSNLKYLELAGNVIEYLPPDLIKLTNLKFLNLSGNKLNYLPLTREQIKDLQTFSINRNPIYEKLRHEHGPYYFM